MDVGKGLPSDFGFALAAHPSDSKTFYIVPLQTPARYVPSAEMAVYRTSDGGKSWEAMKDGLPKNAYVTVLREGLCTDGQDPAGVYVGAKNGAVYYSRDDGDHWDVLARDLPPVLSVSS